MSYIDIDQLADLEVLEVIVPRCVAFFLDAQADGEPHTGFEVVDGYADAHEVTFSRQAREQLAEMIERLAPHWN